MSLLPLLYLDPGSGSLLLYAVIGFSATLFFLVRGLWYKFSVRIRRGKGFGAIPNELPSLVFHSEGLKYWQVFQPVLEALSAMDIQCAYVTSDIEDWRLAGEYPGVLPVKPGSELATISYMNHIKADCVVTTTPHLGVYMMKRSPNVQKYVYLFHAPTSIDVYEKFAFNRYDVMLCPGTFIAQYIRELEDLRGLPHKELHYVGCTYYDYMLREKESIQDSDERTNHPVVLYAPTWGDRSSLVKYGMQVLDLLFDAGFKVIFRPHPQYYVSHASLIADVEARIDGGAMIDLDRNITGMNSMAIADVMITDLSGIVFDFAYLFEKPVILLDVDLDLGGFEGGDLSNSWNIEFSERLSTVVGKDRINQLPEIVTTEIETAGSRSRAISDLRSEHLANFGKAGKAAAMSLVEIMSGTQT